MITEPGIYLEMDVGLYHADPCPAPSLTQSIAKILLDRSPLHAWTAHPRLNPDFQPDDDTKYDVGNIAHKLMLGRGRDLVVLSYDDWRKKEAQEIRARETEAGKLAVLSKHFKKAEAMTRAAVERLGMLRLGIDLFSQDVGDSEVVSAWQEGHVWMRQMIDWLSHDRAVFADYKTTDMSVAPRALGAMMNSAGWHVQAAMGERGLDALHPQSAGRRRYLFVVQETQFPYALQVVEIGAEALTMGRKMIDRASIDWAVCTARNVWPAYPLEIVTPELPGWAEQQWLDREIHEAGQARINGRAPAMLTDLSGG